MLHLLPLLLFAPLTQEGERRPVPIESPSPTPEPSDAILRVYDVAHLTGDDRLQELIREAGQPGHGFPLTATERLENIEHQKAQVASTTESIVRAIRELMDPPFDAERDRVVSMTGGKLAVNVSQERHDWIESFLQSVAAFDGLIDIQTRIYVLPPGRLAALGRERSGQVLPPETVVELLEALVHEEVTQAPRVLVYPFQEAQLMAVDEVAYIKDYELKVLPGQDAEIADPVIDVVQSGVHLELRSVPLIDGKLSVDADIMYSDVKEPIPTFETTLGGRASKVTIQLPEVTRVRVNGRFEMLSGETLALASATPDGSQEVLVLVRTERVPRVDPRSER